MKETQDTIKIERPPVVVVMGHIDHGKSTLLDYIRKTNVVAGETGGITQHMSAYEVVHHSATGDKKITFLDTPGHEAFSTMRARGAKAADIAILVVSAEDGVKAQTVEAWKTIIESTIPYIVAINKIDKPGANIEKTKNDLLEKGIYLEGLGGDVPFVEISAKAGTNVSDLLDLVLLVAELNGFVGNPKANARGIVIESHLDTKRGITATLVIKDGTLSKGMFVVVDDAIVSTKMLEDFRGTTIPEATFSSPIGIVGFNKEPTIGGYFESFKNKKEAEEAVHVFTTALRENKKNEPNQVYAEGVVLIPLVLKTDVIGTVDAVLKELQKLETDKVKFKILNRGLGAISETDIKMVASDASAVVIGFNVQIDRAGQNMNEQIKANVQLFDIIYKATDYLKALVEERTPRQETIQATGNAKVLKVFSTTKERMVIGIRIIDGSLLLGSEVRIMRRDFEIGRAKIINLEQHKIKTKEVTEGESGALIETKIEVAPGDILQGFTIAFI